MIRKEDLLDALDLLLSTYTYGILSATFVPDEAWRRVATRDSVASADEQPPLRGDAVRVATMLQDPSKRSAIVELHRETLKRALLADAHEMLLHYTVATDQFKAYKSQPFFAFARVVRNASSARNGGVLASWPRDLAAEGVERVAWREKEFGAEDVGTVVRLSHAEAVALYQDHVAFARERLS